jgi:4-diphosphocytidyl-2-C-methyl-D-erythritol kinase
LRDAAASPGLFGAGTFFLPMMLEKKSPCKVNLLLNVLGKRPDGFHELETVIHPVNLCDDLRFSRRGQGIQLICSQASLPVDSSNLVHRAAAAFLQCVGISDGVRIHLEKRIPLAAGLGGGSGNAATTLLGLNELFGYPLEVAQLHPIAASLGSDVPFFLQTKPALALGRGEIIHTLDFFPALRGTALLLIHPGFGIPTAWAYQQLAHHPAALHGGAGRAQKLLAALEKKDLRTAAGDFYNSFEAPVLEKYPLLALYQDFLRTHEAKAVLMSGSGSSTFAILESDAKARQLEENFQARFGPCWTGVVPLENRFTPASADHGR